jgi:diketogulonate reductase-like aldo/keto reductase
MPRLLENMGAVDLQLSTEELAEIEKVFPAGAAVGDRYHEAAMKAVNL